MINRDDEERPRVRHVSRGMPLRWKRTRCMILPSLGLVRSTVRDMVQESVLCQTDSLEYPTPGWSTG